MCEPATPTYNSSVMCPAWIFASVIASFIASTVSSTLMTIPLLSPLQGWIPTPIISISLSSFLRASTAQTFVVPISK